MSKEFIKRLVSSIILLPLAFYFIIQGSFFLIFFTVICFIVACFEWHMMSKKKSYYIYGFFFLIFSFYTFYDLSIELIDVLYVIVICSSTDIGGYVFGKIFKGPKLTKISPNKTYSGVIGSFVLSLIGALIYLEYIPSTLLQSYQDGYAEYGLEYNLFTLIIILIISFISQVGDLVVSYFKRLAKIKNTGNILPGHGGLLDRIDGIIFAVPFSYIILSYTIY